MPYKITWYVEQRIMYIKVTGEISRDEYQQLHEESFALVEQSSHKVHAIVDLSEFNTAPTNLRVLASSSNHEKNPNQGITVMVTPKLAGVFVFTITVIMQTLRLEYRMSETIEDAIKIIKNIDVDLANMTLPETI